jgi:hypothetical protein
MKEITLETQASGGKIILKWQLLVCQYGLDETTAGNDLMAGFYKRGN